MLNHWLELDQNCLTCELIFRTIIGSKCKTLTTFLNLSKWFTVFHWFQRLKGCYQMFLYINCAIKNNWVTWTWANNVHVLTVLMWYAKIPRITQCHLSHTASLESVSMFFIIWNGLHKSAFGRNVHNSLTILDSGRNKIKSIFDIFLGNGWEDRAETRTQANCAGN